MNEENKSSERKILLLISGSIHFGGVSVMIINLLKNMDRKGLKFYLYADGPIETQSIYDEYVSLGVTVIHGDMSSMNEKKIFADVKRICKEEKIDVVHCNTGNIRFSGIAMLAAKAGGVKMRITHSHNSGISGRKYSLPAKLFQKLNHNMASVRLACSSEAAKHLYGRDDDFTMLNNGIAAENYRYDKATHDMMQEKLGISGKFVIGHIGRMEEQKNHDYLLDVFAEVLKAEPNAELMLIGKGSLEEQIKAKAVRLGIDSSILWVGNTDRVPDYLQAMDCFVMTSLHEGLAIVLVEAQSAGLPMVLADTITREADIAGGIVFKSIKDEPKAWVDDILNTRKRERKDSFEIINAKGFNIKDSAEMLRGIYRKL